jgi:hypothetical protein
MNNIIAIEHTSLKSDNRCLEICFSRRVKLKIIIRIIIIIMIITDVTIHGAYIGTNYIHTMNSYIRIVATHYSLRTWFVSGI